jgi:hypothetical protein
MATPISASNDNATQKLKWSPCDNTYISNICCALSRSYHFTIEFTLSDDYIQC